MRFGDSLKLQPYLKLASIIPKQSHNGEALSVTLGWTTSLGKFFVITNLLSKPDLMLFTWSWIEPTLSCQDNHGAY